MNTHPQKKNTSETKARAHATDITWTKKFPHPHCKVLRQKLTAETSKVAQEIENPCHKTYVLRPELTAWQER